MAEKSVNKVELEKNFIHGVVIPKTKYGTFSGRNEARAVIDIKKDGDDVFFYAARLNQVNANAVAKNAKWDWVKAERMAVTRLTLFGREFIGEQGKALTEAQLEDIYSHIFISVHYED